MAKDLLIEITLKGEKRVTGQLKSVGKTGKAAGLSIATGFKRASASIGNIAKGFIVAQLSLAALNKVYSTFVGFLKESIRVSQIQIEAETRLAAAMRARGIFTEQGFRDIRRWAGETQNLVNIEDDLSMGIAAQILSLTELSQKQIPDAIRATIQFATVTGKDLKSASVDVSKALGGEAMTMRRYGVLVDATGTKQEILTSILSETAQGWEIAKAKADTFQGSVKRLSDQWGDFQETLGHFLTKSSDVQIAINSIARAVEILNGHLSDSPDKAVSFGNAIALAMLQVADTTLAATSAVAGLAQAYHAAEMRRIRGDIAFYNLEPGSERFGELSRKYEHHLKAFEAFDPSAIAAARAELQGQMAFLRGPGWMGPRVPPGFYDVSGAVTPDTAGGGPKQGRPFAPPPLGFRDDPFAGVRLPRPFGRVGTDMRNLPPELRGGGFTGATVTGGGPDRFGRVGTDMRDLPPGIRGGDFSGRITRAGPGIREPKEKAARVEGEQIGQAIAKGIGAHDWKGLGRIISAEISEALEVGKRVGGGILGGIAGGLFGGLLDFGIGKLFGRGKSRPAGTATDPVHTMIINPQDIATAFLVLTQAAQARVAGFGLNDLQNQRLAQASVGLRV